MGACDAVQVARAEEHGGMLCVRAYPTVSRRQTVALLERATAMLVTGGDEAAA